MSSPMAPSKRHSSTSESPRERSLSINALQKAQRNSRRDSVLPLCMSREQHAALHASPSASHSASQRRRQRGSSVNITKPRAAIAATGSPPPAPAIAANGWQALLSRPEANQEIGRAVQMCALYPTLRVAGTAFENSLNMAHRMSADGFALASGSRRGTELNNGSGMAGMNGSSVNNSVEYNPAAGMRRMSTSVLMETSTVLREVTEESRAFFDAGGYAGHGRNSLFAANAATSADAASRTVAMSGGAKMVQMACAMKRAAMWEVVVVTALAHRAMELKFRRDRLRKVLERHLLPTLLERKKATGSVVARGGSHRRNNNNNNNNVASIAGDESISTTSVAGQDSGAAPQGTYLRDHDAFFASLNNSALLQSFAETMSRHRFLPGEVIARAGQPSQKSMYFLISGKCEVTRERTENVADTAGAPDEAAQAAPPNATAATPTYRDGMRSSNAPRSRSRGREQATSRCVKEVKMPGTSFGGIFGGNAVFAETYRALSQCIVWELRAEDFEQVFRPFSDRVMLDKYKESMRAHNLGWLQQHYQAAKVFGSIPVYRKLVSRKARYLGDFTPVVKVRGEALFAQDDPAGDVYCLLEGSVLRRCRGSRASHGDDGVAQRLATNAFSSFRAMGRFLLLGDEPHILPGVQPYSCTVSTRVALFYRIPGERFVSALLDDPALYAQLRQRLLQQRQANMTLHPSCLAYVPLLQRFPAEKRAELVQCAQPRVVGRSTSLCEPAQHLSELMLVVSGDVCDPRRYGHKPTTSLRVPAAAEGGNAAAAAAADKATASRPLNGSFRGKGGKAERRGRETTFASSVATTTTTAEAVPSSSSAAGAARRSVAGKHGASVAKSAASLFDGDDEDDESDGEDELAMTSPDGAGVDWNFSMTEAALTSMGMAAGGNTNGAEASGFGGTPRLHTSILAGGGAGASAARQQQHQKLCQTATLVYPDESEEINPPLPPQASRSFLYALGGNWEALLLEKWPNGWETASTVSLWAIPTHKLRLVYNSCAKATQSYILNGLRLAQKEDQHLASIPHTKMPPMTVYTQRVEAVVAASTAASETQSQSTAKSSSRRRVVKRQPPSQATTTPPQPQQPQPQPQGQPSSTPQRGHALSLPLAVATDGGTSSFYGVNDGSSAMADPLGGARSGLQRATKANASTSNSANAIVTTAAAGAEQRHRAQKPQPHEPTRDKSPQRTETATPSKPKTSGKKEQDSSAPKTKAEEDAARSRALLRGPPRLARESGRKPASLASTKAATPPPITTIDPAIKAAYDGVFDATDPLMLRIVRDPVITPHGGKGGQKAQTPSAKRAAALVGRSLPPLDGVPSTSPSVAASFPGPTGVSSATWPAQAPAQERWFQAVPSYEPLPGTVRAAETLAAPPVFAPNSTMLASAGIPSSERHGKTLESHVAYYAACSTPSATSTLKRGDATGEVSASVSPHPLPKRRAYAS